MESGIIIGIIGIIVTIAVGVYFGIKALHLPRLWRDFQLAKERGIGGEVTCSGRIYATH
jgi:hypothetical protein